MFNDLFAAYYSRCDPMHFFIAKTGGGHILSSNNSIHSNVKPENFLAMVEATKKFGLYPLDTHLS